MTEPYLSLVIPAFNEAERLPETLTLVTRFLSTRPYSWEVLVVDDGSLDDTARSVERFAKERTDALPSGSMVRLLRNPHRGKGYTVRTGALAARGQIVFLCDADLSMPIDELPKFLIKHDLGYDVVIGSREADGAQRFGEPAYRHVMGRVYNYVVRALTSLPFRDTQCGFKSFQRPVARDLFERLALYGADAPEITGPMVTGYDVELLYLARKLGYRTVEVPVHWYYATGSKVNPVKDTFRMLADILRIRMNDWRGRYRPTGSPRDRAQPAG